MVNLEITGRMGNVTRVGNGQDETMLTVDFLLDDKVLFTDWACSQLIVSIAELREIIARWDAGV